MNQSEEEMKLAQETALDELIVANKLLKKQNNEANSKIIELNKTIDTQSQSI